MMKSYSQPVNFYEPGGLSVRDEQGAMGNEELIYQIGLTMIPGIGDVLGKKLVALCGSAEEVFRQPRRHLRKMARVGELLAHAVGNKDILLRAEKEMVFIERYHIRPIFFQDTAYPRRLRHCVDGPVMLYYKGTSTPEAQHVIGIVGTRNATEYGKAMTRELVSGMVPQDVLVVSGLAYGIDSYAHRFALDSGLNTVGVLGHGLDTVYPWLHRSLAEKMIAHGGLITEFLSGTKPDRTNFPKRNRIIAGLSDAIVVVEAGEKGGALITADIANSYNRDVFAVPGRLTDHYSEGTNCLIRTNRASLIQKPEDIEYLMGWKEPAGPQKSMQRKIFIELTPDEEQIVSKLQEKGQLGIDEICFLTENPVSRVSASLLNLEFEGVVKCLPGRVYELV
ncbi:MAG: DNA-processing protein DprA [Bacteroidota bacterium]